MTWQASLDTARVLVAGAGVTGLAVRDALRGRCGSVRTLDARRDADFADASQIDVGAIDLVVASPGWHPDADIFKRAAAVGIPVIGEIDLAWHLRVATAATGKPAPWLAVTGTNGKTTTVEVLSSILARANARVATVGNVGSPLVTAALDPSYDVFAVELSSFQLHYARDMQALAAVVLNVAQDHLDWHGSMDAYARAKARIYQGVTGACVYPVGDVAITSMVQQAHVAPGARAIGFTRGAPAAGQIGVVDALIVDRAFHAGIDDVTRQRFAQELATFDDMAGLAIDGIIPPHSVLDVLAATALARAYGVSADAVHSGLAAFHTGAHRIQKVAQVRGVAYVDDSKATNPHAAAASLAAQADGSVVWIVGGLTKGVSFDDLVTQVRPKLAGVVVIGQDQSLIREALGRHASDVPTAVVDPSEHEAVMLHAVRAAAALARPGQTVLLAPACASMDQFVSYAHRGEAFASAVSELRGEREIDEE
ncbi:UDP-N-acetylmuramoyl-L-alanine--D-glutamate ligase [Rarobacter incanus]|uniref:UDP-N-acetylmuramoylalanine--D-glutamate ligase n=1 Tax=Rarobacter incanus TaxID=153494 RepID=A0A542SLY8_9MICO|nr:UDP-N-acetylmuramoyl-L-alanine--D-glutamate ligase [Rarobacter incanus]TQK75495.1 UDP-N-acetylmuramoylalanine--D-glutamate ligase [Rarobacter incanus]